VYFDMLNRLGMTHKCGRQRDGRNRRTDILIAYTALLYVARPKILTDQPLCVGYYVYSLQFV